VIRAAATLGFVGATLAASLARATAATPAPAPPSVSPPSTAPSGPAPSSTPGAVPTLLPSANTPSTPPPTAVPLPTATPVYKFVYRPTIVPTPAADPNTPQIAEIDLSDTTVVTPGDVHVRVLTSYAVINVFAQTLGRTVAIPRAAPGLFLLDTQVPGIPFFMSYLKNRTYPIVFSAGVPDGRTASVTLPLTLR
jgi:hypothetical protein